MTGKIIPETQISELMTQPAITVEESTKLKICIQTIINKKISGMPVINERGTLLGIVSEKELLITAAAGNFDGKIPYTTSVDYVKTTTTIKEAILVIIKKNRKWLPVVDNDKKIVGILARRDILKHLLKDHEQNQNL